MFYKIINKIKIHIKLKNKYFKTSLVKSDFKILNIFLKLNIVKNIKHIENNKYYIFLNNESYFNNFINLHKPGKPVKINLKNIIKINRKSNRLFLISSNLGIINNIEAEEKKVGGFLILSIIQ